MYNGQLAIYNEGQHSPSPSLIDIIIKKSHHPTRLYDNYSSDLLTGRAAAARRTGSPALSFMDARLYQRINGQYRSHRSCHVTYRSMWNLTNQTTNNPTLEEGRGGQHRPISGQAMGPSRWRRGGAPRGQSHLCPGGGLALVRKRRVRKSPKKDA